MGGKLEHASLMAAAVGLLIISSSLGLAIGSAAEAGFEYRWNVSSFDPNKDVALEKCLTNFKDFLDGGLYADQSGNRDRVISYSYGETAPALYTWVHCTFSDYTCYQCLHDVVEKVDQCCGRSYGVDIKDERCAMRYETYSF